MLLRPRHLSLAAALVASTGLVVVAPPSAAVVPFVAARPAHAPTSVRHRSVRPSVPPPVRTRRAGAAPIGDLNGWHEVFADDFTTAEPNWPGVYAGRWSEYHGVRDTTGHGDYTAKSISVHNGLLDLHLHTVNGRPQVAAPYPLPQGPGGLRGLKYGRFVVRFRSDNLYGYKTAWLLWPDDNNCQHGEIDWPEGELSGVMWGYVHKVNNHPVNALWVKSSQTYTSWHTAVVQWVPSGVSFFLDGKRVATTSESPSVAMHWVLQTETETNGHVPSASEDGHVLIDWVALYTSTRWGGLA